MEIVQRLVRRVSENRESAVEFQPECIDNYRNTHAWVLLGEPGMGKSALLKLEAQKADGVCLHIAEFVHLDIEEDWKSKIVFLDGLDEVRATSNDDGSMLLRISKQLRRLGNPPFRIACRAADWYGASDREDLKSASAGNTIVELLLEPLSHEDILLILKENHQNTDPDAFIATARERGVAELTGNPQVLELLAKAVQDNQLPQTRDKTYELACLKLVEESNSAILRKKRATPENPEHVLDAAGQICAVLLLSDKSGLTLDIDSASLQFPNLADFKPPDSALAARAVNSKLFRPQKNVNCFTPCHRSVAEFLASRWLARQIDRSHLPLGRVLNLLLGKDSRPVAGLRGVYGWLALHCKTAQTLLVNSDPLTVVLYGDVKPMPVAVKHSVLMALRDEAKRHAGFLWDWNASALERLGDLADPQLKQHFRDALTAPERDEASQSFANCVMEILARGSALSDLDNVLIDVVRDSSRWGRIRQLALKTWLDTTVDSEPALALLDAVASGQVSDADNQLAGLLLTYLYPMHLAPEKLPAYLQQAKQTHFYGRYIDFWTVIVSERTPVQELPALLDSLVDRTEFRSHDPFERRLNLMADRLVARGVVEHGESIGVERLFRWLGIGADELGIDRRDEQSHAEIVSWLGSHGETYKELLALCYEQCRAEKNIYYCTHTYKERLLGAPPPDDIGLWHLKRAANEPNEAIAEMHLAQAVFSLISARGDKGLSIELIEQWRAAHPEHVATVDRLLVSDYPSWQTEDASRLQERRQERENTRQQNYITLTKYFPDIAAGTAPPHILGVLAGVWANRFTDTPGKTPEERFDAYCENGLEVLGLAEQGFRRCLERGDLPSVDEIVELNIEQQEHRLRMPCLLGMQLRWQENPASITSLEKSLLQRMLAFQLTHAAGEPPEWFTHLAQVHPEVVAEVLISYASQTLKAKHIFVAGIDSLATDIRYQTVARIAAPCLLKSFPARAHAQQISYLAYLIHATVLYASDEIYAIVSDKISVKSMDTAQKICWLMTATMLDPKKHEPKLWRFIGKSQARIIHLSNFLSRRLFDTECLELPAHSIGRLVEAMAPHANMGWASDDGNVTDEMRMGDRVRSLITRLGAMTTSEAATEMDRLLAMPSLQKLKFLLESARNDLRARQRENAFSFLSPPAVANVLSNSDPENIADLSALVLDHMDDIAVDIRQQNDNSYRQFWNIERGKPTSQRPENECRNFLLSMLRHRLRSFGVDCQPEGNYHNDKRADIRISYHTDFALPVEIKRNSNPSLWSSLNNQLVAQYSIEPKAFGFGIYLVLWFGMEGKAAATDGDKIPRSARELQSRLEALVKPEDKDRIFVRVLDVSWH